MEMKIYVDDRDTKAVGRRVSSTRERKRKPTCPYDFGECSSNEIELLPSRSVKKD